MKPFGVRLCARLVVAAITSIAATATIHAAEPTNESAFVAIEEAAKKVHQDSLARHLELTDMILSLLNKLESIASKAGDSDKPLSEVLDQADSDAYNLINAQLRYIIQCQQAEILKRRGIAEILSIVQIQRIRSDTHLQLLSSGQWSSATAINQAVKRNFEKETGMPVGAWEQAMDSVRAAQQMKIAYKIPLAGLVERLRKSNFPNPQNDDLELFFSDDLPNNPAYKLFISRVIAEASKGHPDAKEILVFLNAEWLKTKS